MSTAITMTARVLDRLLGFNQGRLAATPEPRVPTPPQSAANRGGFGMLNRSMVSAYNSYVHGPHTRLSEMKFYDFLEMEMAEVPKALDAFATMACTGTLTGTNRANWAVKIEDGAPQGLKDICEAIANVINRECFSIIRGMAKYGSYPVEMVIQRVDSKLAVVDLTHLPPATMFRNTDENSTTRYWKRQYEGQSQAEDLPQWQIPHFGIFSAPVSATKVRVYGISMLQPIGRIALQKGSCMDALVVARLSRAAQRRKIKVDVSDIVMTGGDNVQEKVLERIRDYKNLYENQRTFDSTGRQDSYQRASVPDADYYVASAKDLENDVENLTGDANVGNIKDIEFLTREYLGALGVPAQYLGHADQGGRSNLSQVDIQFARSSRYLQMYAAGAFEHIVCIAMILGGYDPEIYDWSVTPPAIGARDELLNAQIRMLHSQVLANLVSSGLDPTENTRWVMEVLLNMAPEVADLSDEEINKMFQSIAPAGKQGEGTSRPDRAATGREHRETLKAVSAGTHEFVRNVREIMAGFEGYTNQPINVHHDRPSRGELRRQVLRLS